jgi:hypothetical protein
MVDIRQLAAEWLQEHEHHESEPTYEQDLADLVKLLEDVLARATMDGIGS